MNSNVYVLDTNTLIEAKNRYYAFDICPGFWDALIYHEVNNNIECIDRIKKEIITGKYDDQLSQWVNKSIPDKFFKLTTDVNTQQSFQEIEIWVQNNKQFNMEAKQSLQMELMDGYVLMQKRLKIESL